MPVNLTGTYHQTMTGITLGSSATTSGTVTWVQDGSTTSEPGFTYTTITLGAASQQARAGASTTVLSKNVVGAGEVWVVGADWASNTANTVLLGFATKLVDTLALRFARARLSDTAIEWLVAVSNATVIVTLVNTGGSAYSGTVSIPNPSSQYRAREWVADTDVTSTVVGADVTFTATVPAGESKVYALEVL